MLKQARGRGARPKIAVMVAGSTLLAGVGIANLTGASAGTTTTVSRVNCLAAGIIRQNRDMNLTVTTPDSVAPGGTFDLVTQNIVTVPAGEPAPPAGTKVKQIKSYIAGNPAVAAVNNVTFSGQANFTGAWARDAATGETVITLTSTDPAGIPLENVQTPTFTTNLTLAANASGTIEFKVPPKLDLTVTSTILPGDIATNCTAADPSLVMGRVTVSAPPTTTTTRPTTTTTRATTTTSQATTTTTRATTTTSRATTTTSRATTTTSRATTTTRPATTTTRPSIDIFGALWRFLTCLLFGQCS